MTPEQIWQAVATERTTLGELLRTLSEDQWNHPSLCAGWRVRDVVAHIVLSGNPSASTILLELVRARGNLHGMIRDTAIRHARNTTTAQLLDQLRDGATLRKTVLGTTPADRLMDLLVHGQDIAMPLGIRREMHTAATRVALERVWTADTFRSREKFAGYRLVATDADWSAGDGRIVEAPAAALLLLLGGRPGFELPVICAMPPGEGGSWPGDIDIIGS
ncbi:maleylpyruvate isomerase family mycothiol-dependent enzyme [Nocardia sp. NPDC088792]|uniref:maleylpyruvate isomerase family mycothiol-dependent enzyme n=1 Tax=Nocardia sp. NPDC088792 TaxID=3364332 RepID=UPI003814B9CC